MMNWLLHPPARSALPTQRRLLPGTLVLLTALFYYLPSTFAEPSPEIAAALAWYDSIGYPDTTNLPFVRVSTGGFSKPENGPAEAIYIQGFLAGQQGDSFQVFICSVPHAA